MVSGNYFYLIYLNTVESFQVDGIKLFTKNENVQEILI